MQEIPYANLVVNEDVPNVAGFHLLGYLLHGSGEENNDGAELQFAPGAISRYMVTNEGYKITEVLVGGDGWFLKKDRRSGRTTITRISSSVSPTPMDYGPGDESCYIAGKNGLRILEICEPNYVSGAETEIVPDPDTNIIIKTLASLGKP